MNKNLVPILVLLILVATCEALVIGGAAQSPGRVAVHFGVDGRADGWADRQQATSMFEALMLVPLIFLLLALVMGLFPASAFNLPHREYWLAPERRAETVAIISRQLIWMGCLIALFLGGIHGLTIEANRLNPPRLPGNLFLPLLVGFLAATGVWAFLLIRRFYKLPAEEGTC